MKIRNTLRKYGVGLVAVFSGALASGAALAIDTAGVQTAISAAGGDAQTVGGYVIAAIAGLAVVGLVIGIVRKI